MSGEQAEMVLLGRGGTEGFVAGKVRRRDNFSLGKPKAKISVFVCLSPRVTGTDFSASLSEGRSAGSQLLSPTRELKAIQFCGNY